MPIRIKRTAVLLAVVAAIAIAFVMASRWLKSFAEAGYLEGIPDRIRIVEAIASDEISGFREGCGTAVFRVSEVTLNEIQAEGLAFFDEATQGRDKGKYFRYEGWRKTPSGSHDSVLRGLSCAELDPILFADIQSALRSAGSYYTVGYEYDLLLIPSKAIIVLTFSG